MLRAKFVAVRFTVVVGLSLVIQIGASSVNKVHAQAGQFLNVGPGSSAPGDYLRGLGVAGFGQGYYNEATARANAINTKTYMDFNNWGEQVTEYYAARYYRHLRAVYSKRQELWKDLQDRIRLNPSEYDVRNGDALNKEMEQMRSPSITLSAFRYAPVPLTVDMVRTIPFKLAEAGADFSYQGLSVKGKRTWQVALRGHEFDHERAAYERALREASAEQIDSKMSKESIKALEAALFNLQAKLDQVVGANRTDEYLNAKNQIEDLKRGVSFLWNTKIERAMAELKNYPGTTVDELKEFMRKHRLSFAAAKTPEQIELYAQLYGILKEQRQKVSGDSPPSDKPDSEVR